MTHSTSKKLICFLGLYHLFSFPAYGAEYSIFNPVPDNELRNMTTERPSKADSSYTIDSGHLQIETSLYSYQKKKDANGKNSSESALNSTNFRLGLTQSAEIQAIVTPIIWQENVNYRDATKNTNTGFGDTTLRFKYNFMRNDSGNASLAAIPFVKIPTNSNSIGNNAVEGGLIVPFDLQLADGYSFNYTIQGLALRRSDLHRLESVFANIFVLGKELTPKLSSYVEYFAQQIPEDDEEITQSLDFGVVYALTKNITLDGAVNFGLSNRSDDVEILFGGAYRF